MTKTTASLLPASHKDLTFVSQPITELRQIGALNAAKATKHPISAIEL